jgi:hypothetical protein
VWVADRLTGKTLVRHVDVRDVKEELAAKVLAVRTVELLRASLLEATDAADVHQVREASDESKEKPVPKVPVDVVRWMEAPRRARPFVRAEVGGAMLVGFSGSPPAFAPVVRFSYGTEATALRLSLVAPAVGAHVSAPGGSATLRQEILALEFVTAWPARGPWALVGAAGGGVSHVHADGVADPSLVSHRGELWTGALMAGLGGLVRLGERFGVFADVHALLLAPNVSIAVVESTRNARRPMELAALGVWGAF